jgi:hypothetical protein
MAAPSRMWKRFDSAAVGVHDDHAVGEDAVHVEDQQPDARGARVHRLHQNICVRHRSCRWTTPSTTRSASTTTTDVIL